jgi:hypothetical protein
MNRNSLVLELYCRKIGRRREGRERPAMATWRGGGERGETREESKKSESLKRARRGQAAPLIVG